MLEIKYTRQINESIMEIETEMQSSIHGKMYDEMHDEMVLLGNRIKGLLQVKRNFADNEVNWRYDITGLQALDAILQDKEVDKALIITLMSAITALLEEMEKYLMDLDGVLLLPDTIFMDYKRETVRFCYCPGKKGSVIEDFRALVERLLQKLNHKDLEAVELLYGIYEDVCKSDYSLLCIREKIYMDSGFAQVHDAFELEPDAELSQVENGIETNKEARKNLGNCVQKIIQIFQAKTGIDRRNSALASSLKTWKKKLEQRKKSRLKEEEAETFVFEPEFIEETEFPTVLLSERKQLAKGMLIYEGSRGIKNIEITKIPFLIGSSRRCDGYIEVETVSRMHARIGKEGDVYFVEDLNSSNGTRFMGELLKYKERKELEINSVLQFGEEKFRFI